MIAFKELPTNFFINILNIKNKDKTHNLNKKNLSIYPINNRKYCYKFVNMYKKTIIRINSVTITLHISALRMNLE